MSGLAEAWRKSRWLFFGEQSAVTDFYCRDELEAMVKGGTLHRPDTAFSRDQADKVYVRHRMADSGAELWGWLEQGAHWAETTPDINAASTCLAPARLRGQPSVRC